MSKFTKAMIVVKGKSPSHAFIALHRCVEANARLSGETFSSIFTRLEKLYGFNRKEKSLWPLLKQMSDSVDLLEKERNIFLDEMNKLIKKRRIEKKNGIRQFKENKLNKIAKQQNNHSIPKLGFWGWRKLRENLD